VGTIWIREFTGGLDTRRMAETTPGGTFIEALDGHITRGGEFEKRAAFVSLGSVSSVTKGLGWTPDGPVVFGLAGSGSTPSGIQYHQLNASGTLQEILDYDLVAGKLYVAARISGAVRHFYDGDEVDWYDGCARAKFRVTGGYVLPALKTVGGFDIIAGSAGGGTITGVWVGTYGNIMNGIVTHNGDNASTAAAVAAGINSKISNPDFTAVANGPSVTITSVLAGYYNTNENPGVGTTGDVQAANGRIMTGGREPYPSSIGISIGGQPLFVNPPVVNWRDSDAATATALAAAINAYVPAFGRPDYRAEANEDEVTVIAAAPGSAANGRSIQFRVYEGFEVSPEETITLEGGFDDAPGPGSAVKTIGSKVYSLSGPVTYFSGIKQPTKWNADYVGAGFIDMSSEAEGSELLQAIAKYQNLVAIFADTSIQVWYMDPDPALNRQAQVLENTGTTCPHSVTQFGDNDIFYLDESGLRSLRARDASNAAATTDIGVPVDQMISAALRDLSESDRRKVFGIIEPREGRFWLAIKDQIFVYSFFPGSKVSAWTIYKPTVVANGNSVPFSIDAMVSYKRSVYIRAGNTIYVYGGLGAEQEYDATQAYGRLPYLDGDRPAAIKRLNGYDAAAEGQWAIDIGMDPTKRDALDRLGIINQTSYNQQRYPAQGEGTHFSLAIRSQGPGYARIGSVLLHYEGSEEK
jgi:hypothetical protein